MLYQYFIQIVPTIVRTQFRTYRTYQYSVRELEREIDHGKGSHGISGIFFKYDMSGLKVGFASLLMSNPNLKNHYSLIYIFPFVFRLK